MQGPRETETAIHKHIWQGNNKMSVNQANPRLCTLFSHRHPSLTLLTHRSTPLNPRRTSKTPSQPSALRFVVFKMANCHASHAIHGQGDRIGRRGWLVGWLVSQQTELMQRNQIRFACFA